MTHGNMHGMDMQQQWARRPSMQQIGVGFCFWPSDDNQPESQVPNGVGMLPSHHQHMTMAPQPYTMSGAPNLMVQPATPVPPVVPMAPIAEHPPPPPHHM